MLVRYRAALRPELRATNLKENYFCANTKRKIIFLLRDAAIRVKSIVISQILFL